MFTPAEIEAMPLELEKLFRELEERIMFDVVRKLKANGQEITRAADWQLHRLYELGKSKTEIKEELKDVLKLSDSQLENIFSQVIKEGYARDEKLYTATGADFIPFEENLQLQQLIQAVKKQTADQFQNITNSLGFAVRQPDGTLKFQPIADYYQKTLDKAMVDIASGAFDYNTVLKRTIKELTNSGLRTVDYASGWSNRIPVAVRQAVVTGFNQVVAKVNEDNAEKLETNTFEVSWHSGHRPSHWWGGQWFTKEQLVTICGLGTAEGLCGCNCYHSYTPVIPGASVPTYTKEQLAEMEAKEAETTEYNGKEYTKYEALQRQRKLETRMRAQRQEIKLLQEGEANEDDITGAKVKYHITSDEYVRFSEAMDLPQQRERVTVDGLRNIGNIKLSNLNKKLIDNKQLMNYNKRADEKQYDRYREILGENSPKSLDEFQAIKYSDKWNCLKAYLRAIKSGELTPLADFNLYKSTSLQLDEKLIGQITNNGILINGKSDHFIARTIGSVEQRRNGVTIQETLDALINPEKIDEVRVNTNGKSQRFIGKTAIVTINPDTGILIQVNPRSKSKRKGK